MPKTEETVFHNDPSVAENGAPEPKTPGQSQKSKSFCLHDQCPESRPDVFSVTDLIETVNEVSKLSIAHEIVVNQDFYVEETILPPNSVEGRFAEAMYNAFWNHLKEQLLSTPPDFTCALELLKDVKEKTELISSRNYIEDRRRKPLRHQISPSQQELQIYDSCGVLLGIFRVLGLMKMDMVNYTIQSFRPYLQEHSIQYEQAKFQELLDKQPSLLDYTTKWLTKAATDITTPCPSSPDSPSSSRSVACSLPNGAGNNSEPPSPTMVLYQGYLNLLLWDPENEEFPETLLMDRTRLQEMAFQLHQLTVLASVLLVARSFSGEILFSSPEFVDRLKCITKALTEEFISRPEETMLSVSEQVSQEIHQGLEDMGLTTLSSENTASLLGQLQNITKKENCIRSIVDQRIRLFLKCCLLHGMQESLLHFPGGLILIERELAELGWKFLNLMHHNQQVFGPYYAEILKNIIHPAQAQETDVEHN
ncbi:PREDICTED: T-complex protein 11 X-linked protein 2-like [Rhinopithecus bieti]|uniref:T-complex protein 11 X-linked protein 2-like n=1 Tax=Rhinopithecus bieti TaxID=61621 RepID=UPI00083BB0A0|nr:PREDICTED: T-complex protein 11 X-linked protein 2-like [Rhinopithecus bieti]